MLMTKSWEKSRRNGKENQDFMEKSTALKIDFFYNIHEKMKKEVQFGKRYTRYKI